MKIPVQFCSYIRDLTGCAQAVMEVPDQTTLGQLQDQLATRFPALGKMRRSTLMAVGVDYQTEEYVLKDSDEVSLFPLVQGG